MTRTDLIGRGLLLSAFCFLLSACAGQGVRTPPPAVPPEAASSGPAQIDPWPVGRLTIHTFPVGSGNCQVALCPSRNRMIVMDCGSMGTGDRGWSQTAVRKAVAALIAASGNTPELMVGVSHSDADHFNYLPYVFDNAMMKSLKAGVLLRARGDYSAAFDAWLAQSSLEDKKFSGPFSSTDVLPSLSCPGAGSVPPVEGRVLAVNAGSTNNDSSMVVSMTYGKFRTLFTGDMTDETEALVYQKFKPEQLLSTVLTAAHHGASSDGSNSPGWAWNTKPNLLVVSSGTRYGHPKCRGLDFYVLAGNLGGDTGHPVSCSPSYWPPPNNAQKIDKQIFVTNNNGSVSVAGDPSGNYTWVVSALTP